MPNDAWRILEGSGSIQRLLGEMRPSEDTSRRVPWWFAENKEAKMPTKPTAAPGFFR